MSHRIMRRLEFDAGHRVLGHEGKCRHLHGHRYVCEVVCETPALDGLGRVVDFGVIKQLVGGWIDKHWDHNMLLNPHDPLWLLWRCCGDSFFADYQDGDKPHQKVHVQELFGGKEPYVMPARCCNPTAENIADVLLHTAQQLLAPHGITVVHVRVWETPTCAADAFPSLTDFPLLETTAEGDNARDKEARYSR